ncbi:hypothetical protein SP15_238 [Bacillus phage SP-15]|uniref:Uncharacterized protein n=1 Tax=Bacillus phage SP-15 TaxID=1792032 RepID=A0A127AZ30_9CAUD|nr:hypothetical protein SP15_238 [Bacillus phage SP-15]AMM45041.1 hypothetical protein SP15_238 [Bacillus phage SP-15]
MAMKVDTLYHNQVREGLKLVVKDDFTVMAGGKTYNLNKGWRVRITDVVSQAERTLVRVKGDFVMGTTIDTIVQLFDRVIEEFPIHYNDRRIH